MDFGRGPPDQDFPGPATRDQVGAAIAQHPAMRKVLLKQLVADLHSTMLWPRTEAENFVLDTAAVILDFLADEEWPFVERVIENVQQRMHDEFIDTSWPECPEHGSHPLWLSGKAPWRWTCTDRSIPLGELKVWRLWFGHRIGVLVTHLDSSERVVARGRMAELGHMGPDRPSLSAVGSAGDVLIVTDRRILWVTSNPRWVTSLPFELVTSWTEITQAHRYALVLDHREITRLQWVFAHHFLWWSWGNAEGMRARTRSILGFSHRDTKAAQAIRAQLSSLRVPAGNPIRLPVSTAAASAVLIGTPGWRRLRRRRPRGLQPGKRL